VPTPPPVIALFGPTGVGKTAVAIALAARLRAGGEDPVAISADALQVYEGLGILTGAASAEERQHLEHRLVGILPIGEACSAGRYAQLAHAEIDRAIAAGRRPIVVGGTGLYLRAALAELDLRPPPDPAIRARLTAELDDRGAPALHDRLERTAPETAARIATTDGHRIVRALELIEAGQPPPQRDGPSELWTTETRVPTRLIALTMDRQALYERIEQRVDAMIAAGAAQEVRAADAAGASATARKALGFQHLLDGDVETMKRDTRRYARRQLTWLRKLPNVTHVDVTGRTPEDVAAEIDR
jgi:tRNA dimethylallyltransferase